MPDSSFFVISNTAAPAPSPNNIHVLRSVQSIILERTSLPITKAFFPSPHFNNELAIIDEYKKPEQAALISNAEAFMHPKTLCTLHAVEGIILSGDVVATIIISILSGIHPAIFNAFFAALTAKSTVPSPVEILLSDMPVLFIIHSCDVSTIEDNW